jgi:hypothetical protein
MLRVYERSGRGPTDEGKEVIHAMTEGMDDRSSERRPIRVAIREEELEDVRPQNYKWTVVPEGTDDVEGQSFRYGGLGQTEEEAEGQTYMMVARRRGEPDDTEGQGYRWGLEPGNADDTEGQVYRWSLRPADPDEVTGQLFRYGGLKPAEDGTWTLELDEDTEGQGIKYGG